MRRCTIEITPHLGERRDSTNRVSGETGAVHRDATLERVKQFKRVLVIQDTTELDYTKMKNLEGTGPLSTISRQGFFAHNQLVVTPERLSLGVWNTQIYARDEQEHGKKGERKQTPIEQKESYRWLQGYRDACDMAQRAPGVQVISCADREGDIYEVFEDSRSIRVVRIGPRGDIY